MHGIQSLFPWLKNMLPNEEYDERRLIITSLVLLFDLSARLVGINQMRSVYYPALSLDANIEFMSNQLNVFRC